MKTPKSRRCYLRTEGAAMKKQDAVTRTGLAVVFAALGLLMIALVLIRDLILKHHLLAYLSILAQAAALLGLFDKEVEALFEVFQ